MAKNHPKENKYLHKIIGLGISKDLISDAAIKEEHYQTLYKNLKRTKDHLFLIKNSWQLSLFAPSEKSYNELADFPDRFYARFIHFAALAGNLEALEWAAKKNPCWFSPSKKLSSRCIRFAFMSNHTETIDYFFKQHPILFKRHRDRLLPLIKEPNQLDWVLKNTPELLDGKPENTFLVLKNAAKEDQVTVLRKLFKQEPKLLDDIKRWSKHEKNLADIAASKGSTRILNWFRIHLPELLKLHAPHHAALSGNLKSLNWFLEHCPEILDVKLNKKFITFPWEKSPQISPVHYENQGNHIGFYAVFSKDPMLLDWFKHNRPQYLKEKNAKDYSPMDYALAAPSYNKAVISELWRLSDDKQALRLHPKTEPHASNVLSNVHQFMKTNFFVTRISNLPHLKVVKMDAEKYAIGQALKRNQLFQKATTKTAFYGKRKCPSTQPPSEQSIQAIQRYYRAKLPEGIDENIAQTNFDLIIDRLHPTYRFHVEKKRILSMLNKELKSLSHPSHCCSCDGKNERKENRRQILSQLQDQISRSSQTMNELRTIILDFYHQHLHQDIMYQPIHLSIEQRLFGHAPFRQKYLFQEHHQELLIEVKDILSPEIESSHSDDPLEGEYSLTEMNPSTWNARP